MRAPISPRPCFIPVPVLAWCGIRSSHLTEIWFHLISWKKFWSHLTRESSCSDSVLSHLMTSQFHLIRESSHSDSVLSHLMKDWSHLMKIWSHSNLISSHLIEAWSHFSSDLKSEQNRIFWFWLSNTNYIMQKEQKALSSSIINACYHHHSSSVNLSSEALSMLVITYI